MNKEHLPQALAAIKRAKTSLSLKEMWLEELPQEIAQLASLKTLNINHNSLAVLPDWITNLGNLQSINLWGNSLATLPENIGALKKLKKLQLEGNNIEKLPESLGDLSNLEELVLESNGLEELPESVTKLSQLKVLDLGRNPLKKLPETIGNLTNLTRLNLTYTQVKTLPASIGKLKKLEHLYLYGLDLEELPPEITGLESLTQLHLSGCKNFKTLPANLSGMTGLEDLGMEECNLKQIPAGIFTLPALKFLRLVNNHLDHIPEELVQMKSLEGFFFTDNHISVIPHFLVDKTWLTIDLANNDIDLKSFPKNFADFKLKYFYVGGNPFAELKLNADFLMPPNLSIYGLTHKISKKSFSKEINQLKEAATTDQLQEMGDKYLAKLNKSIVKWNGREDTITDISDFQKMFLKLLFDKKLAKIKKTAKTSIEIFYESSPRKVAIDIDKFSFPEADNTSWEITLNNKNFMGPVVVITMNGWDIEDEVLVG